jgi:hypothetical protein
VLFIGASDGTTAVSRPLRVGDVREVWIEICAIAWSTVDNCLPPPLSDEDRASRDAFYRAERERGAS